MTANPDQPTLDVRAVVHPENYAIIRGIATIIALPPRRFVDGKWRRYAVEIYVEDNWERVDGVRLDATTEGLFVTFHRGMNGHSWRHVCSYDHPLPKWRIIAEGPEGA